MMPRSGTFDYVFHVSDGPRSGDRKMRGKLRDPHDAGDRLLGHAPTLEAVEYKRAEWQLYSRVTLAATGWRRATASRFSFSVDRALITTLRAGDTIHVSRTSVGGLGFSILRGDELVAAVGAITSVELGTDLTARHPRDLIEQVERVFRTRDPEYKTREFPIELTAAGETRIVHKGRTRVGPYDAFVIHGFIIGIPGTAERACIERRGVSPETAALTTAQLFGTESMEMGDRPGPRASGDC